MITEQQIREAAENEQVYQEGCLIFRDKTIRLQVREEWSYYVAELDSYRIFVKFGIDGALMRSSCSCSDYYRFDGACKHIIAALKKIQRHQTEEVQLHGRKSELIALFKKAAPAAAGEPKLPVQLIPTCCIHISYGQVSAWLEFTIGQTRQYVMRSVENFLRAMMQKEPLVYGKNFTLEPAQAEFEPVSGKLADMMISAYEDEHSLRGGFLGSSIAVQKRFILAPSVLERFFKAMGESEFRLVIGDAPCQTVRVIEGRPPIKIAFKESFGKGTVSLGEDTLLSIDRHFCYLLYNSTVIYKVDPEFSAVIRPLMQCFAKSRSAAVEISREEVVDFFSLVMPELEKAVPVKVDPMFMQRYDILPLNTSIYLDREGKGICAEITFSYGERSLNPAEEGGEEFRQRGERCLVRDAAAEQQILSLFHQYGFQQGKNMYIQEDEALAYDFLKDAAPILQQDAEVYYADSFQGRPLKYLDHLNAGIRINDQNMLELSLEQNDFDFAELLGLLASYRLKKRYHRLKDGTFLSLESEALDAAADFMEQFSFKPGQAENTLEISPARAVYLDALARDSESFRLRRSAEFKAMVREIKEPDEADIAVPETLRPVLRDYQQTGFRWLYTLARYGLGGILADDMGLGKTLQVIAFILAECIRGEKGAVLVVTPTSLLYNWAEEVERFAPRLRVRIISGAQAERREKLQAADDADIILTTYNLLKRDIDMYKTMRFRHCFLDEAQYIKNPGTQNAKAVKMLCTRGYFALTGTPIENTLTELWSIFDFLMPGYLFSHQEFKRRFEMPIIKEQDEKAACRLHRYIAPFVLRRLKRDVLKELPDKTESKRINEMTEEQAKVYDAFFVQALKEFEEELKKSGLGGSRIKVLALLTRLRQICCHPSLFLENYEGGSGKLEMLKEIVENAVESGHRMLVFSQFTSMLALIRSELDKMGIEYFYLDGQTPSLERMQLVKAFNKGTAPVFLISLKAGGTGLNLTGADMVLHYDPWWNPAVEEQATDRAYRLGQQKNVQVLKLITKDTIEERIFLLQQKKKALIEQLIQPGETFISGLSEEELRNLFKR